MIAATYFIDTRAVRALAWAGLYTTLLLVGVVLFAMAAPLLVTLVAIVLPVVVKLVAGATIIALFGWVTYPKAKAGK